VDPATKRLFEILDEARAWARPTGPTTLRPEYLRAIDEIEALPENQPGADKGWVEKAGCEFRDHYKRAVRVR
jgi:hypothetical protein